ncbi:protein lev-9-like [Limulus polyphemus]|uniref:Protein lev-9-like n=1 Tax=Limulus polyphemus TaxID=6850 RepID=A0ABM1T1R7_LIMPO|nr:protein lev-9-like [Limulus polyphemus]
MVHWKFLCSLITGFIFITVVNSNNQCGAPTDIKNGYKKGSVYEFPANVTYFCNMGYELEGISTIYCLPNGEWSNEAPVCNIIQCPDLQRPEHGAVSYSEKTYKSTAEYTCDSGYQLHGEKERLCQADKEWSGDAPTCEKTTCPFPNIPGGEVIQITGGNHGGAIVTFRCVGTESKDEVRASCLDTGAWSKSPPECKVTYCPDPQKPHHGDVQYSEKIYNSKAEYSCDDGYKLYGEKERYCQEDGKWSGEEPVCKDVDKGSACKHENVICEYITVHFSNLLDLVLKSKQYFSFWVICFNWP